MTPLVIENGPSVTFLRRKMTGGRFSMGVVIRRYTGTSTHVEPIAYDGVVLLLMLLMEYRDKRYFHFEFFACFPSLHVDGVLGNEIKHDHIPVVIVILGPTYD